jgi:hypothetical protein
MTPKDFVPLTQYTELKNMFLKLNDRRNKLEVNIREVIKILLKVSPKHEDWIKKNFGEYL